MAKLQKIVYLTEEQKETLFSTGSVTSGGVTITYSPDDLYVTPQTVTKGDVGLGNVDNTSDANKPISTATQTALNGKISSSEKGAANGVAELDSNGKIASSQLPSYVDDVLEYASLSAFPATGETGKIYVAIDTNLTYRWSGSAYVAIGASLALGETSSTAYRGDRGKAAYDAAVVNPDTTPTQNSSDLITSGGVYTALDDKADKTDTVLNTTLSRGRVERGTVGEGSFAFGEKVAASGDYSHAENGGEGGFTLFLTGDAGSTTYTISGTDVYSPEWLVDAVHYNAGTLVAAILSYDASTRTITLNGTLGARSNSGVDFVRVVETKGPYSHAEGQGTVVSNNAIAAHAEGQSTIVESYAHAGHAEGYGTIVKGMANHAEGYQSLTTSGQPGNHAEGYATQATGGAAHSEGRRTLASGVHSHAEGSETIASGQQSHAEGNLTTASGKQSHAEGGLTTASGKQSHAEGGESSLSFRLTGSANATSYVIQDTNTYTSNRIVGAVTKNGIAVGSTITAYDASTNTITVDKTLNASQALNNTYITFYAKTRAAGDFSHAEGMGSIAIGAGDHAEGCNTETAMSMPGNHAEGYNTKATGGGAHAENNQTVASGNSSHAEGILTTASGQAAHAEGLQTTASNTAAHAEGLGTTASGEESHAEGNGTTASGLCSHAEGLMATASEQGSHAEGLNTLASGNTSHAEGNGTTASGNQSHAEGNNTLASGDQAHAEGSRTTASGAQSHAEGYEGSISFIKVTGNANATSYVIEGTNIYTSNQLTGSVIKENNIILATILTYDTSTRTITVDKTLNASQALSNSSITVFVRTKAIGAASHAEGQGTIAGGIADHTEGYRTETAANMPGNHAEGYETKATGGGAHSEGQSTIASGFVSHSEGYETTASGYFCHAEGESSSASAQASHAEGQNTSASGYPSHAEGSNTTASGSAAHAEGAGSTASQRASHAEGDSTNALAYASHAEGSGTTASEGVSHAEGYHTNTSGYASHAEGFYTNAAGRESHVSGRFNIADSFEDYPLWVSGTHYYVGDIVRKNTTASDPYRCITENSDTTFTASKWRYHYYMKHAEIIGNGTADDARSNARTLTWEGTEEVAGDVIANGCGGANPISLIETAQSVATKYTKPVTGIPASDLADGVIPTVPVQNVQVNGTSVLNNGVANVPVASSSTTGVVEVDPNNTGIGFVQTNVDGQLVTTPKICIIPASNGQIKNQSGAFAPVTADKINRAAFYGLAKAAGADMSSSSNPVGTYTDAAKTAIKTMLGVTDDISSLSTSIASKYQKPQGGIPKTDLADDVQDELDSVELLKKPQYIVPVEQIENPTLATSTAAAVINDALEYANQNGYEIVLLPPGEYLINETIYLQDNVILKGSGTTSTKLKIATGYNIDCIRVDHPVHDAGIKDLTIDGNKIDNYSYFHQSTEHGNAINVWLHRGIIENVRTEYVYKHALLMNYDVGSSTADGLGFDPEDEYRQGNLNKVMHCNFDNSTLEGVMWGWRTMDSLFCYNNIGSNGANLYLEGGTSRFIGNHFDGDGDDGVGPEYNVFCPNGCNTMLFEGNIFENTKKHNFYFKQPSYNADASYGIQITNNIIRTGSKEQNATYNLIDISGYSSSNKNHDIVITGNSLLNPNLNGNKTLYGIHLAYCDDVTIGNNTFFNIAQDNVKIESTCSNIYVDGIDDTAGSGEKQKTWSADKLSQLPTDVQISGTSILSNGIANIPISGPLTFNGTSLTANTASESSIKTGTANNQLLTPEKQHMSAFFGLAKAAGADMAALSNTVGTYTDSAKIAIQKMLGVYQAPWELIREDTVTNASEADISITVDGNGNSFELTDLRIVIISPVQQTQFKKAEGRVSAYYSQNDYDSVYIGAYTQIANEQARHSFAVFEQNNGMVTKYYMRNTTLGDNGFLYAYSQPTGMFYLDNRVYTKVLITKVTGKLTYKLFGRRKWT